MASTSTVGSNNSRKDYLKKYLSSSTGKRKKSKNHHSSSGMRLIETDSGNSLQQKATSSKDAYTDEEDSEDELMGLIKRQKTLMAKGGNGPGFRNDTFVTIHGSPNDDSLKIKSKSIPNVKKILKQDDTLNVRRNKIDKDDDSDQEVQRPLKPKSSTDRDMDLPRRNTYDLEIQRKSQHQKLSEFQSFSKTDKEIKKEVTSEDDEIQSKSERRTLEGKKAGLVGKHEMVDEIRRLKEQNLTKEMDDEITGRFAETKRRSTNFTHLKKHRSTPEDEARKEREAAKQKELEEKYGRWNKGVAQIEERQEQIKEMEKTLTEGFSRYADDKAMNEHLKDQLLEEDPMAEYFKVKRHKVKMRTGLVYPEYKSSWPPNRYTISPGYRWDGVDRSNGFEGKIALEKNSRQAREDLTYRTISELTE